MTIAGLLPSIAKLVRHAGDERDAGRTLGHLQPAQFGCQMRGPLIGGRIGALFGMQEVLFVTDSLLILCAGVDHRARTRSARSAA